MEEIFHEIEEDLRRENLIKIWRTYGNYIIAGVVLILLVTASFLYWQHYQFETRADESRQYTQALRLAAAKKYDEAITKLVDLTARRGDYVGLSELLRAEVLILQADSIEPGSIPTEVTDIYRSLSNNNSVDSKIRHIAQLFLAMIEIDSDVSKQLVAELQKSKIGSNPWSPLSTELLAILAYKQGNFKQAKEVYQDLADSNKSPPGQRARARALAISLDK